MLDLDDLLYLVPRLLCRDQYPSQQSPPPMNLSLDVFLDLYWAQKFIYIYIYIYTVYPQDLQK